MPNVFGYGRHSTKKQGLTEEVQRRKVEDYIKNELADCTYMGWRYDQAISGASTLFERPAGRDLWFLSQPGDHVVWAKYDRAFRSVSDGSKSIEMLTRKGVFVHSLDNRADVRTPHGELTATINLAVGQWERRVIGERTSEAIQEKRSKGLPYGPGVPYGWKKIGRGKTSRFEPDMTERSQIRRIFELHESGNSYAKIERLLVRERRPNGRKWNHNTARKALIAMGAGYPKRQITD